jgi:hypothetical protein
MTNQSISVCAKCSHVLYNHENADLSAGKCRYHGCRCRLFREAPTAPPRQRAELEAELTELGLKLLPPEHWIFRQGTVFVVPDQVDDGGEDR